MQNQKTNIRILNSESLVILLIFFIGFLLLTPAAVNQSSKSGKSAPTEASIDQNSGVLSSGIRLQILQKTGMLNRNDFKLLSFNKYPFLENKRVEIKISFLQNIHQNLKSIPIPVFRFYTFPGGNDEFPLLS